MNTNICTRCWSTSIVTFTTRTIDTNTAPATPPASRMPTHIDMLSFNTCTRTIPTSITVTTMIRRKSR